MGIYSLQRSFLNQTYKYMPRLDGTGPQGLGPRTGRGLGKCSREGSSLGRGLGCGRGRLSFDKKEFTKEDQKKFLLEERVRIEKELAELENAENNR